MILTKKLLRLAAAVLAILCAGGAVRAQSTSVSWTITDPNGLPYSYATAYAQVLPQQNYTLNGVQYTGVSQGPFGMDVNGSGSATLVANTSLSPGGSQWCFTFNITPGIAPPMGFGPQAVTPPGVCITITGSSQSISTQLSAAAPALSRIGSAMGNLSSAASFTLGCLPKILTSTTLNASNICQDAQGNENISTSVNVTGVVSAADGVCPQLQPYNSFLCNQAHPFNTTTGNSTASSKVISAVASIAPFGGCSPAPTPACGIYVSGAGTGTYDGLPVPLITTITSITGTGPYTINVNDAAGSTTTGALVWPDSTAALNTAIATATTTVNATPTNIPCNDYTYFSSPLFDSNPATTPSAGLPPPTIAGCDEHDFIIFNSSIQSSIGHPNGMGSVLVPHGLYFAAKNITCASDGLTDNQVNCTVPAGLPWLKSGVVINGRTENMSNGSPNDCPTQGCTVTAGAYGSFGTNPPILPVTTAYNGEYTLYGDSSTTFHYFAMYGGMAAAGDEYFWDGTHGVPPLVRFYTLFVNGLQNASDLRDLGAVDMTGPDNASQLQQYYDIASNVSGSKATGANLTEILSIGAPSGGQSLVTPCTPSTTPACDAPPTGNAVLSPMTQCATGTYCEIALVGTDPDQDGLYQVVPGSCTLSGIYCTTFKIYVPNTFNAATYGYYRPLGPQESAGFIGGSGLTRGTMEYIGCYGFNWGTCVENNQDSQGFGHDNEWQNIEHITAWTTKRGIAFDNSSSAAKVRDVVTDCSAIPGSIAMDWNFTTPGGLSGQVNDPNGYDSQECWIGQAISTFNGFKMNNGKNTELTSTNSNSILATPEDPFTYGVDLGCSPNTGNLYPWYAGNAGCDRVDIGGQSGGNSGAYYKLNPYVGTVTVEPNAMEFPVHTNFVTITAGSRASGTDDFALNVVAGAGAPNAMDVIPQIINGTAVSINGLTGFTTSPNVEALLTRVYISGGALHVQFPQAGSDETFNTSTCTSGTAGGCLISLQPRTVATPCVLLQNGLIQMPVTFESKIINVFSDTNTASPTYCDPGRAFIGQAYGATQFNYLLQGIPGMYTVAKPDKTTLQWGTASENGSVLAQIGALPVPLAPVSGNCVDGLNATTGVLHTESCIGSGGTLPLSSVTAGVAPSSGSYDFSTGKLLSSNFAFKRPTASQGTALSGSTGFSLGAGWGSTGSVTGAGFDPAFKFTVTPGGTGIAASPTLTYTFIDGTWTTAPICQVFQAGGNDIVADPTISITATVLTVTWNGTPTSGKNYIFSVTCMGTN